MDRIYAPFSEEEVDLLKEHQNDSRFHSYTCGECGAELEPEINGWRCFNHGIVQKWAHDPK